MDETGPSNDPQSPQPMIESHYTFESGFFRVYDDGRLIESFDHVLWDDQQGTKYELLSLLEDEAIAFDEGSFTLPLDLIYRSLEISRLTDFEGDEQVLSESTLSFLSVPPLALGSLELESNHAFRSRDFTISKYYRHNKDNQPLPVTDSALITIPSGEQFLLSKEQAELCGFIDEQLIKQDRNQEDNFQIGAKVQKYEILHDNIKITGGRLAQDEIDDIDSIRPKFLKGDDGGVKIGLDIDSGDGESLEMLVNESPFSLDVYTKNVGRLQRKRFILSERSKEAIESFKKKSRFTREEKESLLSNPEEYLKGFNLDDYSERVVGFGVLYAPKLSPFKNEDEIEWVVETLSVGTDDDTTEVNQKQGPSVKITKENAHEFQEKIDEADEKGINTIPVDGEDVLITQEFREAVKSKLDSRPAVGLITRSNIEEVDYLEGYPELSEFPDDYTFELPDNFYTQWPLKTFQKEGCAWLDWLVSKGFPGGLLADDMGMGKTVQICSLLARFKEEGRLSPSLLVLPKILESEWKKELGKFVPTITFKLVSESARIEGVDSLEQYDVIAVTYDKLTRDQKMFGKIPFKLIVCDEVQFIKNPATFRTQAVLAMNGEHKIASTATPIENSISELWSILDYSNPGYLPSLKKFNKDFGERNVTDEEYERRLHGLRKVLKPVVMRRTKEDHLKEELPIKLIKSESALIDNIQLEIYREIVHDYHSKETLTNFLHFFQVVTIALNNPELLEGKFKRYFSQGYRSPKLQKTIELLNNIKGNNEKVLIFANRKAIQRKLADAIEEELGVKPNIINGDTPTKVRDRYTSDFRPDGIVKNEFDVLILSPKCAGFGLNLVQANHVIHYTRSFNPAVESQATDRVYRIGQDKPVYVYNLIATTDDPELRHTVEDKLDEMLNRKSELLKDYLYTSRVGKVRESELSAALGFEYVGMSLQAVDALNPIQFEVFTAALFEEMGYQTSLTPAQDFGADCVAIAEDERPNILAQCKKKSPDSMGKVGNEAVQQIVGAKSVYERDKQISFEDLVVITNGNFTDQAKMQAKTNRVRLIDRSGLAKFLQDYVIQHDRLKEKQAEHSA